MAPCRCRTGLIACGCGDESNVLGWHPGNLSEAAVWYVGSRGPLHPDQMSHNLIQALRLRTIFVSE